MKTKYGTVERLLMAVRILAMAGFMALVLVGTASAEVLFSDDFESDLSKWVVGSPINSQISSMFAHSGSNSLKINGYPNPDIKVRYTLSQPVQGKLTVWYYDPKGDWASADYILLYTDATYSKAVGIGIFDDQITPGGYYRLYQRGGFGEVGSNAPRSKGWHKFEFDISDNGTKFIIDDKVQSYIASEEKRIYRIDFDSGWNRDSIAYWDDISVVITLTTPTPTTPAPTIPTPTTTNPTPTTPAPTTPAPTTPALTTPSPTLAVKQPMLTVSHTTLKEEPEVGEEVLITVTVQNNGEGAAKNIRLTEQLPSSITVSYIDGATSNTPNLVTWNGELAPNRAHAIVHTLKIVEKKSRAIPVTIRYEDEAGNPRETSTTIYVTAQVPVTPTPAQTKAPEAASGETTVKIPGFTAPLVLIGLVGVILLVRRR